VLYEALQICFATMAAVPEPVRAEPAAEESAVTPVVADADSWRRFTPSSVNTSLCMARVWASGAGGQCRHAQTTGGFCKVHNKDETWRKHGRVDGEIPAQKLQEFIKASTATQRASKRPSPSPQKSDAVVSTPSPKKSEAATVDGTSPETPAAVAQEAIPETPAPKKPTGGAFGVFMKEKRGEFAEASKGCEGNAMIVVIKKMGEAWKGMSEEDKAPYTEKYNAASAQYKEDMAAWLEAGGQQIKRGSKRKQMAEAEKEAKKVGELEAANSKLRQEVKRLKEAKVARPMNVRRKKCW